MNLTTFQINIFEQIEQRSDFAQFVLLDGVDFREMEIPERKSGPLMILWYDIEGALHGWRTGQKRVLRKIRTPAP